MLLQLLGRLHILLLHFPIGILLLTALLEWVNYWKWIAIPRKILTLNYGIGSASAILACITGYILSGSGDYTDNMVENHMWAGIITAFISVLLLWYSYKDKKNYSRWGVIVLAIAITIAGHLGGTITHGEGFFTDFSANDYSESKGPVFKIENLAEAEVYGDLVKPILEAKCVTCHGPSKKKGKLRLDSKEALLAGGKSGKAIIGINPDVSELVRRIQLPLSEEKHMPPKKKMQITPEELLLIQWWIDSKSPFDKTLKEVAPKDTSIYTLVTNIINASKNLDHNTPPTIIPADLPDADLEQPTSQIMDELMQLDIVALQAGKESPFLEINFVNVPVIEPRHWAALQKIAPHIIRLKLSGQKIKDEDLIILASMKNLMKLFLDETQITNEGLKYLLQNQLLEYLNLNGTTITNEGITILDSLVQLQIIYAYQTAISLSELPGGEIKIENGNFKLPFLETDTIRI